MFYDSRNNSNAIIETATNTIILGCSNTIIPNSVENIGEGAFNRCSNLTSVMIPNSVTIIGDYAFSNCKNLVKLSLGNSVKSIGEGAFINCSNLGEIRIPDSVTRLKQDAFMGTKWYNTEKSNSQMYLDGWLIYDNSNWIQIKEGTRGIADRVFNRCENGSSTIKIPNSVASIGEYALLLVEYLVMWLYLKMS